MSRRESVESENKTTEIVIITTGGTIEKVYDEKEGTLENRGTLIRNRISSRMRLPYTQFTVYPLLNKDSLYMDDEDRLLIVMTIRDQLKKNCPILVVHGTDTMAQSATRVFQEITDLKVPVVFTGAMIPMGFEDSDATQNVTEALLACKLLPPGVYISFHNQIFKLPNVRKNKEKRTFEAF